jgi:hypothetical protein
MQGLSADIEIAIKDSIKVLNFSVDIDDSDPDKLQRITQSKIDGFLSIKKLLVQWEESQNAPSHQKLKKYIQELVNAGDSSIDTLREALKKEIIPVTIEPEKHGSYLKSKPLIFQAITQINYGVLELKMQLDADKFDLKEREFRRGYPERFANQELFPIKNYYKEWYNEKEDAIIIDPKGTKGEIIVLDNLRIQLPAPPKSKKQILFSNLPKEEQYWRRPEPPKGLNKDSEDQYADFILEEFRRRREGIWFMNNGTPVWLCPAHYMGLVHNQMLDTGGYKEFRMAQCYMYYFTLACIVDPRCVGELFIKGRRTGFTEEIIDYLVNDSTSISNALMGMTSKTGVDAQEAFLKYSYGIQNLPFYFIPVVKGKIDNQKEMVFGKPSNASKENKKTKDTSTKDYVNTKVDFMNSTTLAYDSKKLIRYLCDEAGKREKPQNIIDHWNNVRPTMVQGGRVVGKCFMGSTLNPRDKGGEEFITLYEGSDVTKRNENGMTTTGLYSFFLPAHKNMEDYTDKYGFCHEILKERDFFYNYQGVKKTIGSYQYLQNEFKSAKTMGSKVYNNVRRLDPVTIEDAFRDEATSQLLPTEKINEQLKFNRDLRVYENLVRGNFEWRDAIKDTEVVWKPCSTGRFLLSWNIPKELNRNKYEIKKNYGHETKCPLNENIGAFGCDPYDQSSVVDSKLIQTENGQEHNLGSKGALHGVTRFNLGDVPSNEFFLEYIARPKDADTFFEDILMACVYFSMPVLVENNKKMMLKHFRTRGYRGFCMTRFDKDETKLSQDEKELGGIPNNSVDIINQHWTALETYIINYVGEYSPEPNETHVREVGQHGRMYFERTLRDWSKFNIQKRTEFDASISSGLALMAINKNKYVIKKPEKKVYKITLPTYN